MGVDLQTHFGTAGTVTHAEIGHAPEYGFVVYATKEESENAILLMNGSILNGLPIEVDSWSSKNAAMKGLAKGGAGGGGGKGGGYGGQQFGGAGQELSALPWEADGKGARSS